MMFRRLIIFVEGTDDISFFEKIIKPILDNMYDDIRIISYSQKKIEKIDNYIKSIKSFGEYFYVTDLNNSPCISFKKNIVLRQFKNIDEERIMVVVKEIESWYLAGLTENHLKKLKIKHYKEKDCISKEEFDRLAPKSTSRKIFMHQILDLFSIKEAKKRNRSFEYFVRKFNG